jgi:hypothetical protein
MQVAKNLCFLRPGWLDDLEKISLTFWKNSQNSCWAEKMTTFECNLKVKNLNKTALAVFETFKYLQEAIPWNC